MNSIGFILIVSTIMWLIIDWAKPAWAALSWGKYLSMGVALIGATTLTITFGLDLLIALELTEIPTVIGGVFAALSITAGSGLINELIKALGGIRNNGTNV